MSTAIYTYIVDYYDTPTHYTKGALNIEENYGTLFLNYYSEVNVEQLVSNLRIDIQLKLPDFAAIISDFSKIKVTVKNGIILSFMKQDSEMSFSFQSYFKVKEIFHLISKYFILKASTETPTTFEFIQKDTRLISLNPFIITNDYIKEELKEKLSIARKGKSLQQGQPKTLSESEFKSLFDENNTFKPTTTFENEFYNCQMDNKVSSLVFDYIVHYNQEKSSNEQSEEPKVDKQTEYIRIKEQWQATPKLQWEKYPELRRLVNSIENDIVKHSKFFRESEFLMQVSFNVLLTLSYWNRNRAYYNELMVYILHGIIEFYVEKIEGEKIIFYDGASHSQVESESIFFHSFIDFYLKNKLDEIIADIKTPRIFQMLQDIGDFFVKEHSEVLQLYQHLQSFSLLFLVPNIETFFINSFSKDDIKRLMISSLCIPKFLEKFSAALLLYTADDLFAEKISSHDQFIEVFQQKLSKANVAEILSMAQNLKI
ncbi:hypothetical protein TVAG_016410 [Trichomonas vaginalis G3]|uniref:Rab-GAP TBC domain-containing protein n=1 Tax=Trichomonas vaginalis (strain ATCC PRA-98 / G3) TaxID=412133 RepID=A2DPB1_TRIV3|nr:regulation of vesicle fusion [Trichomonas vaginalis G3]EAY17811.1 hypothetical protein TVAG_016410 [Trichomonas vaginalis G3]KAI5484364.1 regulation of vesicle fusion [Trichomonas vaginalis G3]|eukprot:XP_001329946.1 hypothetical protein [Trichomonas vaginalis G3]